MHGAARCLPKTPAASSRPLAAGGGSGQRRWQRRGVHQGVVSVNPSIRQSVKNLFVFLVFELTAEGFWLCKQFSASCTCHTLFQHLPDTPPCPHGELGGRLGCSRLLGCTSCTTGEGALSFS